jgi:ribosome-binding protein aMBF1 (putative translation factor)
MAPTKNPARLKTHGELVAEELQDDEFREEWDRLAFARAVAVKVIEYRADHGLSQRQLAEQLGLPQPQVARLETGEHDPSQRTLTRLAGALGIEFTISITGEGRQPTALTKRGRDGVVAEYESHHSVVRYAVG